MKCSWREGNKIQLLENGEQYYPAVFKAIGEAQERIILETFTHTYQLHRRCYLSSPSYILL